MTTSPVQPRIALVTGGSRGIGAATARRLGATGCYVYVNYRSRERRAKEVVADILAGGGQAEAVGVDVRDEGAARAMVQQIRRSHGRLDILVNSAGITNDGYALMMSDRKWSAVIDTSLTGAFHCCREGIMLMLGGAGGAVVNVASVSGVVGLEGQANYSAAKAGVIGLTKSLAAELADRGVRVNAVLPGLVDTELVKTMPSAAVQETMSRIPMARLGTADEIAAAVCWLASSEASYITGTTLVVDGGLTRH
jgi:3-oxoacyl-[acyl-carrier protein] reductase